MHKDTSGAIFCKQICQTHFGAKSAKPEFGKFYELGLLIILIRVKTGGSPSSFYQYCDK